MTFRLGTGKPLKFFYSVLYKASVGTGRREELHEIPSSNDWRLHQLQPLEEAGHTINISAVSWMPEITKEYILFILLLQLNNFAYTHSHVQNLNFNTYTTIQYIDQ